MNADRIFILLLAVIPPTLSGSFWQITDIHWDSRYDRFGNTERLCRGTPASETDNGYYGNFSCESPIQLVQSAIAFMAKTEPNPDFILWTGDSVTHTLTEDDPYVNWTEVYRSLHDVNNLLAQNFPNATIVPVLGNHDVYPADLYPTGNSSFYSEYIRESGWSAFIGSDEQETFASGGYYWRSISADFAIAVLNTNLMYIPNTLISENDTDPNNQFQWLTERLDEARLNNTKVLISGHVPPGYWERFVSDQSRRDLNDRLVNIVLDYSDVILTTVFGHLHTDALRLFAVDRYTPKATGFVAPSLSPQSTLNPSWFNMYPGVRRYRYDVPSAMVLDYDQYFLNLTTANREVPEASWQLWYNARTAYEVQNFSVPALASVYHLIATTDPGLRRYYNLTTFGADYDGKCDDFCQLSFLCCVGHISTEAIGDCMNSTEGRHHLESPKIVSQYYEITHVNSTTSSPPPEVRFPYPSAHLYSDPQSVHLDSLQAASHQVFTDIFLALVILISIAIIATIGLIIWKRNRTRHFQYTRHISSVGLL